MVSSTSWRVRYIIDTPSTWGRRVSLEAVVGMGSHPSNAGGVVVMGTQPSNCSRLNLQRCCRGVIYRLIHTLPVT